MKQKIKNSELEKDRNDNMTQKNITVRYLMKKARKKRESNLVLSSEPRTL